MSLLGQQANSGPMKDDPIPDDDHVSRYVAFTKLTRDGRISGAAFQLRPDEDALSVNWLEYFGLGDRGAEIQEVRKMFADKGRILQAKAKFAVLDVGATKEYVQQESDDNRVLSILHDPLPSEDESHAGIYNVPRDDPAIGDMIAELIEEEAIHPARDPAE
jgi:hypothetical protein